MTPTRITSRRSFARLTAREQDRYEGTLEVLARLRGDPELTLTRAARETGIDPRTVRRYAGDAVERRAGRLVATPADRLFRPMFIYSAGRRVDVDVRGSRQASVVGRYHAAIHATLRGDPRKLRQFAGRKVAGFELEADLDVIEELARRGALDVETIYRLP
jgi:hypothetical protein